jgi:signal transduction histidine kinase
VVPSAGFSPTYENVLSMNLPAHKKTRRRLAFLFSVPLAFSLVFFFFEQDANRRETQLLDMQRIIRSVLLVQAKASDTEAAERGFYLTRGREYLTQLKQIQASLPGLRSQMRKSLDVHKDYKLSGDNLLILLMSRVAQAIDDSNQEAEHPSPNSQHLGQRIIENQKISNRIQTDSIALISDLGLQEKTLTDRQELYSRLSFVFFSIGSLIMIGVIIWLYNVLLRYLYERDAANENLKTANTYLEARIEERTQDLTRVNAELQQFAYVASHDLQEPLRTITSFSQLLATRYRGSLDSDADEFIGYIVSSSRRMTDLINGLLALVRLRKAGQPTAPVSFEHLLEQAEISLQASIRENNATITHGPLPSLVVDSVQFSQVLQNLLSNAMKYRRQADPVIEMTAEKDSSNWIFSIKDNGQGFDPQFAERIFGLFQRLQNRDVDGTGMGLSIARKIVERHGGRMWAQSTQGEGSTFSFSLPVTLEGTRPELVSPDQKNPSL